jgi:membrane dipeptidase
MRWQEGEWDILCYKDAEQAHTLYRRQLDSYTRLVDEHPDKFRLISNQAELNVHLQEWKNLGLDHQPPVGLVPLMEGAEGVRHEDELPEWWERGVRMIGPAWAGTRFCGGTKEPGPLTKEGYRLLEAMADLGFILDISHMDPPAAYQALDAFSGRVIATHANPLGMLPGDELNRFLPDRLIEMLLERDGVIGIVSYNRFLSSNWAKGMRRELVSIHKIADHIDYVCQLAGDARHVGFGSDFDGGFGLSSVPPEIDTIADLHKLAPLLTERGYSRADLSAIFSENWLAVLQSGLPKK